LTRSDLPKDHLNRARVIEVKSAAFDNVLMYGLNDISSSFLVFWIPCISLLAFIPLTAIQVPFDPLTALNSIVIQ
jgi:hypothetical protein